MQRLPLRRTVPLVLLTLLIGIGRVTIHAAEPDATRPRKAKNIVFLFTDDQRWDTIAALGNPEVKTPVLDELVRTGYRFDNCYCQGSWSGAVCLPSRIMMMTGQSVWRIQQEIPRTYLPEVFNRAGYATFRSGKRGNVCTAANDLFGYNFSGGDDRHPFTTQEHVDRAIKFLDELEPGKPFFLLLSFDKPHDPRRAPLEFMEMYDRSKLPLSPAFMPMHPFDNGELYIRDEKLAAFPRDPAEMRRHLGDYYACVSDLDHQIGRLLGVLKEKGLAEETVIVFSSDQGLAVGGEHGLMGKQNLYESNKPPLFFAGPGIPKGRSQALVYLYDLFPTFCDLTGLETPDSVEGKSLLPIIEGERDSVRDFLYGAYKSCQRMVRDDRFKLIKYHAGGVKNVQLFDLQNDPDELVNLADDSRYAEQRKRLEAELLKLCEEMDDPVDFEGAGGPASVKPGTKRPQPTIQGKPATPGRPIEAEKDGGYLLRPEDAKIVGDSLRYQPERDNLGSWQNLSDYPCFTLSDVPAGRYRVEFSYGNGAGGCGYAVYRGDEVLLRAKTEPTGGFRNCKAYDLGEVELHAAEKAVLSIRITDPSFGSAPMNFYRMRLIPVR